MNSAVAVDPKHHMSPRALRPRGALRRGSDLVHRRLADPSTSSHAEASAQGLVLTLERRREPGVLRRRRPGVRVVGDAPPVVGGVEERERLPPRAGAVAVVCAQAAVDDPPLVPQPVLHLPQRLRRHPPPAAAAATGFRDGAALRRLLLLCGRGRCGGFVAVGRSSRSRRRGACGSGAVLEAGGAEGRGPLRVERSPARLVRQARVRLQHNVIARDSRTCGPTCCRFD